MRHDAVGRRSDGQGQPAPRFPERRGRQGAVRYPNAGLSVACPRDVDAKRRADRRRAEPVVAGQRPGYDGRYAQDRLYGQRGQAAVDSARLRPRDSRRPAVRYLHPRLDQAGQGARAAGRVGRRGDVQHYARERRDERSCDARLYDRASVARRVRSGQFRLPLRADRSARG